jgi:hypothetical protein
MIEGNPMSDNPEPVFKAGPTVEEIEARTSTNGAGVPKRGGRTTGTRRPRRSSKSLEPQIRATLVMFNMALLVVPPLQADALDEAELFALAKALDLQAKQSPRFRRALEAALTATSGAGLVSIVAIIGARRAARHGAFGPQGTMIDAALGGIVAGVPLDGLAGVSPEPEPSVA